MRTILCLIFLSLFLWNCKQAPESKKVDADIQQPLVKTEKAQKTSPILLKLVEFADTTATDTTDITDIFVFKQLNENGEIASLDPKDAVSLHKKVTDAKSGEELPIFELKKGQKAVLMVNGRGFAGPLWAKILVDKDAMTIEKIEFDHSAESEGYGDGITYTSFEKQFVGAKIDLTDNTFSLFQSGSEVEKGNQRIDGLSGATMTSQAVVKMVNEGLKKYKGYLNPE
ncbi:FMN-binding protein [Flagellimonas lutaonensis]|uniref:FMN-binding domain-containing protein n=1 Tax=Flagellimonas lutaonensis TaxID=516051 RepID=A0A0D5YQP6_9FLAO|nr:FMN-binding protein [Allomuricauda lutaonensis]AKA34249.1 hypothetical protein VC82_576 [Allomuricauda lutaonensis]